MQNTNRVVTLFSTNGFGRNELFENAVPSQNESVSRILSAFSIEKGFIAYLRDQVFKSQELENSFCLKLASTPDQLIEVRRHIRSLKNNNTASDRTQFINDFIAGNDAVIRMISSGGIHLFELPGIPDVYGVQSLTQTDTTGLWIPVLLRCVWALCKDVTRIQLVLHDKDVPEWKRSRRDDVTIIQPADYSHFIPQSAFSDDDESKELFDKISTQVIEIKIVFFHHTTNFIAKIVGSKPPQNSNINTLVQSFIDSQFGSMKDDINSMDQTLM